MGRLLATVTNGNLAAVHWIAVRRWRVVQFVHSIQRAGETSATGTNRTMSRPSRLKMFCCHSSIRSAPRYNAWLFQSVPLPAKAYFHSTRMSLLVLARQRLLPCKLLLRLLVAMRDESVQERTRPALSMSFLFGLFGLFGQVTSCLVIDVVLIVDLVKICCDLSATSCVMSGRLD